MSDLDTKIDKVVTDQEESYMDGVIRFVKVKEKQLNEIIEKLKEKNNSLGDKDYEILDLKKTIISIQ